MSPGLFWIIVGFNLFVPLKYIYNLQKRVCDVMGIKEDPPDPFDEIQEMHENYVSNG